MPYHVTIPAMDGFPEESFVVEASRKPEAYQAACDKLYSVDDGWSEAIVKQFLTHIRKTAIMVKLTPPKKADWWPGGCPMCEVQILRSDIVAHIRGFHGIQRKVKA